MKKYQMGLGLSYKVSVAAIPIKILSKLLLQHVKNALGHGRGFHDGAFLGHFLANSALNFLKTST